jgi:epoxyqueuosine reductase
MGLAEMKTENIFVQLADVLQNQQAVYRMIHIDRLIKAETEIQRLYANGSFNDDFYQERLTSFRFSAPDDVFKAQSILMVAVPQPTVIITFFWKGSERPVTLPPTYDQQTDKTIKESVEKILNPEGYSLCRSRLPEKVLATHSGLMQYGRNNIGYVPLRGSFYRPVAFYTDLPCREDHWEAPVMMERCIRCRACIKACPTGAIGEDRFLLHAERCITFHNEHLQEIPDYIPSSMHHCLLGCMICQQVCPENREFNNRVEVREHFTEEETLHILEGVPYDALALPAQKKLDRLSLTEDYTLMARNLGLLLH